MTTIAAPQPSAPPPQVSPGGHTVFRVALVAAATLLVASTLVGLSVSAWALSTVRVATDHQKLPGTMRSLVVDTAQIPVAVRIATDRESSEPSVALRLINASRDDQHRLAVSSDGDATRISIAGNPSPILEWARGGELTVTLPPEQARRLTVRTQQDTGVLLADADLDQLIARSVDSSVVLSGAARRIEIDTVDGEVSSGEPISVTEEFIARTSDGDISVDFRDAAPRTVEATSRNGDIDLGLPRPGPYLVRAQSGSSAKVHVPGTNNPANAAAEITADSDYGDVVIEDLELGSHGDR